MSLATTKSQENNLVEIGERNGLQLAILPRIEKTIGEVILRPDSETLLQGVRVEPRQLLPDDRGFFVELARLGSPGIAERMGPGGDVKIQVSAALSYPGTIKAIHFHFQQTDLWVPVLGMFQVFLYDLRRGSITFGGINTLYVGSLRPWSILIPPGVAHGYKVLGPDPALLVYLTDCYYNPFDEGRLPYNHPGIQYHWETQFK
jgi:dTDP-4-dehydrorhamnose 3,5-epimerase